jgi:hypothetical protein
VKRALLAILGLASTLCACPDDREAPDAGVATADGGVGPERTPVLNEVACAGDRESVELANPGPGAVRLDGLRVADSASAAGQALSGTLAASARVVVELAVGNRLRRGEEVALLLDGDRVIERVAPPVMVRGASGSRLPDTTGAFALGDRTPGAVNAPFGQAAEEVFAPFAPPTRIELALDRTSQVGLASAPGTYVPATFSGLGDAPLELGVRLEGRFGSFRGCPFGCGE